MTTATARPRARKKNAPNTGAARNTRSHGWRKVAGDGWRGLYVAARWVVRFRRTAALASLTVAATPLVTLRDVGLAWLAAGAALGIGRVAGAKPPVGGLSLHDTAKFRKAARAVRHSYGDVMAHAQLTRASRDGGERVAPRLRRIAWEPHGLRLDINGRGASFGVGAFADKAETLKAGFGALDVTADGAGSHNIRLHLRLLESPNFGRRPVRVTQLPTSSKRLAVYTGVDDHDRPMLTDARLACLTIGATGAGKTEDAWTTIHQLLASGLPLRLRIFDPKLVAMAKLKRAAWQYENDPSRWPAFLESLGRAVTARYVSMESRGIDELTRFSWAEPFELVIIDEFFAAVALGRKKTVKLRGQSVNGDDALRVIMALMRAAGFGMRAASQLGTVQAIGDVRNLFSHATLLRVGQTDDEAVRTVLGASPAKYPAHLLPTDRELAGIGFRKDIERGPIVKMRGAYLTEQQRAWTVTTAAEHSRRIREATKGSDEQ